MVVAALDPTVIEARLAEFFAAEAEPRGIAAVGAEPEALERPAHPAAVLS